MSNRLIATLAALALLAAGLLAWYVSTLETRTVHYVTPARNAAAYNPLFVLEQALQELDYPVSSHRYVGAIEQPLMPGDTVVMLADGRQLNRRQARQLADAVEQGLHLVALHPSGRRKRAAIDPGRLLRQLGFQANPDCDKDHCDQRLLPPDGASVEQHDRRQLSLRRRIPRDPPRRQGHKGEDGAEPDQGRHRMKNVSGQMQPVSRPLGRRAMAGPGEAGRDNHAQQRQQAPHQVP